MKTLLAFAASLFALCSLAQGPILRTPFTVNTAPVVTNIVRQIATNAMTITNNTSAVGVVSGGGGSYGIGTNTSGISGSGIPLLNGQGTNTDLLNPSYRGNLTSTNPVQLHYTGSQSPPATPFSFRAYYSTNGYNPAVNNPSAFSNINDEHLDIAYNDPGLPSHDSRLPVWVRAHESAWFNPFRQPQMENYDRIHLTNQTPGAYYDVGFGYTLGLEDGYVDGGFGGNIFSWKNQFGDGSAWMTATVDTTNGEGVLQLTRGIIDFSSNTNFWRITDTGVGVYAFSATNTALRYLFGGGLGTEQAVFFHGANADGNTLGLLFGSYPGSRGIRYNGTLNQTPVDDGFQYQSADGTWKHFDQLPTLSSTRIKQYYPIPFSTGLGANAGDWRHLGWLTNGTYSGLTTVTIDLQSPVACQRFIVPLAGSDSTHTSWEECLPLFQGTYTNGAQLGLDIKTTGGHREFRIRRLQTDDGAYSITSGYVSVSGLEPFGMDTSTSGSGATVVGYSRHTPLAQLNGRVGINTNNPQATLHVAGNAIVSGTNQAGYFTSDGANAIQMPTNAPVDGYAIVAVGAGGQTKFAASAGSGSATNAIANTNGIGHGVDIYGDAFRTNNVRIANNGLTSSNALGALRMDGNVILFDEGARLFPQFTTNLDYNAVVGGRHRFFGVVYFDDNVILNGTIAGDGSLLTALNADGLASGTVSLARLPYTPQPSTASLTNWSAITVTNSPFSNSFVRATSPTTGEWTRDGSGLTNITGGTSFDLTANHYFSGSNYFANTTGLGSSLWFGSAAVLISADGVEFISPVFRELVNSNGTPMVDWSGTNVVISNAVLNGSTTISNANLYGTTTIPDLTVQNAYLTNVLHNDVGYTNSIASWGGNGNLTNRQVGALLSDDGATINALGQTNNLTTIAFNNNGSGVTNVQSTNVVGQTGELASSGNQTNYTVPLLLGSANDTLFINAANTNIFITFTGTNTPYAQRTLVVDAFTNTVTTRMGFISSVRTNSNFSAFTTNGTFKILHFLNRDSTGTNVLVTDGGRYLGAFTQ